MMFLFNWIFKSVLSMIMSYVLYGLGVLYIIEKTSSEFGYELDVFDMFRDQIMSGVDFVKEFATGKVKDSIGLSSFGDGSVVINKPGNLAKYSGPEIRDHFLTNPGNLKKVTKFD